MTKIEQKHCSRCRCDHEHRVITNKSKHDRRDHVVHERRTICTKCGRQTWAGAVEYIWTDPNNGKRFRLVDAIKPQFLARTPVVA